MCNLQQELRIKSKQGYKIVAKMKGKKGFYSLAMGFLYPGEKERIPIVKKQDRISGFFLDDILVKKTIANNLKMEGRTAIFVDLKEAKQYYRNLADCDLLKDNFRICLVEATIYDDILKGTYGYEVVYAGRRIKFGKMLKSCNGGGGVG